MAITFESPLRSGLSPLSRLSGLHPLGKVSICLFVFNSALLDLRWRHRASSVHRGRAQWGGANIQRGNRVGNMALVSP